MALALLGSCTHAFFSGWPTVDRSRPVVRIETTGGVEFGACTTEGILFLGRTATEGPCRVHYFLGPRATPLVEDGVIEHAGGVYYRADIDLKTQAVALFDHPPTADDNLIAMAHAGYDVVEVPVTPARVAGVEGDVLEWPGRSLPAGTGIFARSGDEVRFVGLVCAEATIEGGERPQRFVLYTGTDRLRELLASPTPYPRTPRVKHRPDDITVFK